MCAAMAVVTDGSRARAAAPRKRFRLLDAMILVAATATGCAVLLAVSRTEKCSPYDWCLELVRPGPGSDDIERVVVLSQLTMPLVATVTLALIPIRSSGARPPFRRLARQPGFIASCASGMTIAFIGLPLVVGALFAGVRWVDLSRMLAAREELWSMTMYGGLAILISWITLLVRRRWRAERSWIDRFARAMGLYWVAMAFAVWAVFFYYECESSGGFEIHSKTSGPLATEVGRGILNIITVFMRFVAMVTLALIPVRLFTGRPRLRRLARQPGMVASCAAAVAIVLLTEPTHK